MIVVPTVKLGREIEATINTINPTTQVKAYYSEDYKVEQGQSVVHLVCEHLDKAGPYGEILVICRQCFTKLPYINRKSRWQVFIDEGIPVFEQQTIGLQESFALVTDCLSIPKTDARYGRIEVTDRTMLRRIAENSGKDRLWVELKELALLLLNDNYRHYVRSKQYSDLKHKLTNGGQLSLYSLMSFRWLDGFEKVTVTAAGLKDTLMYDYWERLGVKWREDACVVSKLLRRIHPINPSIKIYYGYEDRNSKYQRNKLHEMGNSELRTAATKVMNGEPFVWLENKDWLSQSVLNKVPEGDVLPPMSHGLNEYANYHNAVVLAAYNHTPDASMFLSHIGGFDECMQTRSLNLGIYQALMRTSVRNDDTINPKKWVVASRVDAELLAERLPGAVIESLNIIQPVKGTPGPARKHETDKDRKRAYEEQRKEWKAQSASFADKFAPDMITRVVFLNPSDELAYKSIGKYVGNFRASFFNNMYDTSPKSICMKQDKFITYLRNHHNNVYAYKHDLPCVSGAMFNPLATDGTQRSSESVEFVRGIWIDVENGDLTPEEFSRHFPMIQFVAYNTFSHTKDQPRFRLYLPTSRIMAPQESRAIYHQVRYNLNLDGYINGMKTDAKRCASANRPFDGIDCRPNPASLSMLPCQAKDNRHSFFLEYVNDRSPIDVDQWLKHRLQYEVDDAFYDFPLILKDGETDELTSEQQAKIDAAFSEWDRYGRLRGNGDTGLYSLYIALRRASVSINNLQLLLYRAVSTSSSPRDRKRQADRLIKKLR
ncbi:hypothetical protein AEGHOMDF_2160 [Methylobacterium soli]|nr:hypothetical protein AEGHOMDF_2160 [Methylobacterium soli]